MRAVIQRVLESSVVIDNKRYASIGNGLMILVGVEFADTEEDIKWLCKKIVDVRIFDDEQGIMNKSIKEIDGDILLISQFTLHASIKKGNRPSYLKAAKPDVAIPLYKMLVNQLQNHIGKEIKTGLFGADMKVSLTNDGPITIFIDTKNKI